MIKFKELNPEIIDTDCLTSELYRKLIQSLYKDPRDICVNAKHGTSAFLFYERCLPNPTMIDIEDTDEINEQELIYYKKWLTDLYRDVIVVDLDKEMDEDLVFKEYSFIVGKSEKTAIIRTPLKVFFICNIFLEDEIRTIAIPILRTRLSEISTLNDLPRIKKEAAKVKGESGQATINI